jgi:seryl-tRNA synthetase
LMICCISPSSCNLDESINALKYASRARYIKNKPIVNMDPEAQRFVEMQSEIQALREELHRQRSALLSAMSATPNQQQNDSNFLAEIRRLQDRLQQSCSESERLRALVNEAHVRFKQLSKEFNETNGNTNNSSSKFIIIDEWIRLFESVIFSFFLFLNFII